MGVSPLLHPMLRRIKAERKREPWRLNIPTKGREEVTLIVTRRKKPKPK